MTHGGPADPLSVLLLRGATAVDDGMRLLGEGPHGAWAPEQWIFGMFNHCRSLHVGITQLVAKRLTSSAMVLARPLFEDSVRLEWMSRQDETYRRGLIIAHRHSSLKEMLDTNRDVQRRGLTDVSRVIREIESLMRQLEIDANTNRCPFRKFGDIKTRARALGRVWDCVMYDWMHQFVHGGVMAVSSRVTVLEDEGVAAFTFTDETSRALSILAPVRTRSMMLAFRSTASMLRWRVPSSIEDALAEANRIRHP